jgi:RNA polymerase sigma factor (sigma-70 family)
MPRRTEQAVAREAVGAGAREELPPMATSIAYALAAKLCPFQRGRAAFDDEDFASIALIAAFEAVRDFNGGGSLKGWVAWSVEMALRGAIRSREADLPLTRNGKPRLRAVPLDEAADVGAWDPDAADRIEQERAVTALRWIPPREAFVLRRRLFDGATHPEVGADLGVSATRSHQIQRRALERMREVLAR